MAKRIERSLRIAPPNPDLYQSVHKKLLHQASRMTPLFEEAGPGKIYLDFTGFDKLYGRPDAFARKIKDAISYSFNLSPRLGSPPISLSPRPRPTPIKLKRRFLVSLKRERSNF